ncbi:unnamed protein product [Lampetra fluviatilis]
MLAVTSQPAAILYDVHNPPAMLYVTPESAAMTTVMAAPMGATALFVTAKPPQVEPTATGRTAGVPAMDLGPAGAPPVLSADAARRSGRAVDASPAPPPMVPPMAPPPVPASTLPVPMTDAAQGGGPAAHTRSRGVGIR